MWRVSLKHVGRLWPVQRQLSKYLQLFRRLSLCCFAQSNQPEFHEFRRQRQFQRKRIGKLQLDRRAEP